MGRTIEHEPKRVVLKTQDNEVHKVCAYCRVSTDDDQKNSLEAQEYFFANYFKPPLRGVGSPHPCALRRLWEMWRQYGIPAAGKTRRCFVRFIPQALR